MPGAFLDDPTSMERSMGQISAYLASAGSTSWICSINPAANVPTR
jgi:hypothetical protein